MSLVEAGKAGELSQKASFFRNPNIKACPYCFQPVTNEYKSDLVTSIEKVLSKTVADHQKALEACVYGDVIIDLSNYSPLESCEACVALIDKVNTAIRSNNALIQQKIENPYQPIGSSNQSIAAAIKQLTEALVKLEQERIEYNKKSADTRPIIKKLNEINSHIAHYDVVDLASEYDKQKEESEKAEKAFADANRS